MDMKKGMKRYGLWLLKSKLNFLKNERPLIFKIYKKDLGYSSIKFNFTVDELKDVNNVLSLVNLEKVIADIERSIKHLEEELNGDIE